MNKELIEEMKMIRRRLFLASKTFTQFEREIGLLYEDIGKRIKKEERRA